jgi:uncharacterized protein YbjT (DUF2867 family)
MKQRILLAGSSGLVGGLVKARLEGQSGMELTSLVRRGSAAPGHAIDYEELCKAPKDIISAVASGGIDKSDLLSGNDHPHRRVSTRYVSH